MTVLAAMEGSGEMPLRKKAVQTNGKRNEVYEGDLDMAHEYRDGLLLVAVDEAPEDSHFVSVRMDCIPPETYYVFDPEQSKIVHMVSVDANGTYLAWDIDRDGRYFTGAGRPLMCPRHVEWCYDASVAISKGQVWDRSHPNYLGTLSGRPDTGGVYVDYQTPDTRKKAREAKLDGDTTALLRVPPAKTPKVFSKVQKSEPPKKMLRRKPETKDTTILTARGLDDAKLKSAAENLADKYGDAFLSGEAKIAPKKRTLRRKR